MEAECRGQSVVQFTIPQGRRGKYPTSAGGEMLASGSAETGWHSWISVFWSRCGVKVTSSKDTSQYGSAFHYARLRTSVTRDEGHVLVPWCEHHEI